jgi:FkbM family methyltransferase
MYPEKFLAPIYRNLLNFSSRRGERTLARVDSLLFNFPRTITFNQNGEVSIVLPPDPHFFKYLIKSHETHISNAIQKLLKPGDLFLDIGANIGYFSAYAASAVGKTGQVFCFEPEAKNFEYLQVNCDRLQKLGYNCSAFQLAASSMTGTATLNLHRYSTYHAIEDTHHKLDRVEGMQTITTVTLAQWFQSQALPKISLAKIDTEGHEPKVLEGAIELFEKRLIDFTVLECRSDYIANYIDEFAKQFNLYQFCWDGFRWSPSSLRNIENRSDCLLSTQPISLP